MSQLSITVEARLFKAPTGQIYTENNFAYDFWSRYLNVFDHVRVFARVQPVLKVKDSWKRVDGEKVKVIELPCYIGPLGYLKNYFKLKKMLLRYLDPTHRYILRVGSPIADIIQPYLVKRKIPYGVEVVGDPWEVFKAGVFKHPLRKFFQLYFSHKLRRQCREAIAGSYVTQKILQIRYPLQVDAFSVGASSIELHESDLVAEAKVYQKKDKFILSSIGSMEYGVKGFDILIMALNKLNQTQKQKFELHIVGDGRERKVYESLVKELKLSEQVKFLGTLSKGKEIQNFLDQSDFFILASRSEGLPRVVIEAMSRGLFCLGSDTGGIIEQLPAELRFPVGDWQSLSEKISYFADDPAEASAYAKKLLEEAKNYLHPILSKRRESFYRYLASYKAV